MAMSFVGSIWLGDGANVHQVPAKEIADASTAHHNFAGRARGSVSAGLSRWFGPYGPIFAWHSRVRKEPGSSCARDYRPDPPASRSSWLRSGYPTILDLGYEARHGVEETVPQDAPIGAAPVRRIILVISIRRLAAFPAPGERSAILADAPVRRGERFAVVFKITHVASHRKRALPPFI